MSHDSESVLAILRARGVTEAVTFGIVLGTGLSSIADSLEGAVTVSYADLPGFPKPGVSGHAGQLVIGEWDGVRVAIMQGRAHYYETGDPQAMRVPLETLAGLGTKVLVLTNSAGSMHSDWYPGSMVVITDHINLTGVNPLIGVPGDDRFVPLTEVYDRRLRARLRRSAAAAGVANLREGVYMWFSGPSFETPAEVKVAKQFGADLVGMSTVPEAILARWLGMRVAALSVVTNFATGIAGGDPSHEETKQAALSGSIALKRLLRSFVRIHDAAPT